MRGCGPPSRCGCWGISGSSASPIPELPARALVIFLQLASLGYYPNLIILQLAWLVSKSSNLAAWHGCFSIQI